MADDLCRPQDPVAIRDEQVARALSRLDERGDLTARERAVIERLGDRITAQVLWLLHGEGSN